jgi:hypothetical protein
VKASVAEWQERIEAVVAYIPESDAAVGIKMLQVGGFQLDPQPHVVNDMPCLRMVLT